VRTFADFWPFYLREHAKPATRWMHFVGTTLGLVLFVAFLATREWRYLVGALVVGYLFAWLSHLLVEKNKPATFKHPLWSFLADWKMWALMLTGKLK
jgi:hypothetical protein